MRTVIVLFFSFFLPGYLTGQDLNGENLFDHKKGVSVVDFSSSYGGSFDVECILQNNPHGQTDGLPAWCTAQNAPFPHFITVELVKPEWLDIIEFNNAIPDETGGWKGISAKDVEVYVSTTAKDQGFTKIVNFRLEKNKLHQIVKINPVQARWVKFVITSNYGHPEYTEFGRLGVFDDKQRNVNIDEEIQKSGFVNLYGLYFDFGLDIIKPESFSSIDQIVEYLKKNPSIKIQIEGHTDNIGTDDSNQILSEKRANSVRNEIVKKGINADRMSTKGFGSKQPISQNSTDIGRAQNRRVTIRKM
jgi:outer membrane protein OmpA-like peptidoglycan-associated protein